MAEQIDWDLIRQGWAAMITQKQLEQEHADLCKSVADRIDAEIIKALCMTVPMGPLSTKPTDGATPGPATTMAGMYGAFRCRECTLLRVAAEGLVCEECANATKD